MQSFEEAAGDYLRHETKKGGAGSASLVAHAAIIAGVVAATASVGRGAAAVAVDTPLVFIPQPRSQPKPAEAPPPAVDPLLKVFRPLEQARPLCAVDGVAEVGRRELLPMYRQLALRRRL